MSEIKSVLRVVVHVHQINSVMSYLVNVHASHHWNFIIAEANFLIAGWIFYPVVFDGFTKELTIAMPI